MTEESALYKPDTGTSVLRSNILGSAYFKAVKDIACSLCLGYESFTTDEELCDRAIELTDKLIERAGEKI